MGGRLLDGFSYPDTLITLTHTNNPSVKPPSVSGILIGGEQWVSRRRGGLRWRRWVALVARTFPWVFVGSNVTDRDLEIDRDMEHGSDTDYPLINKRYLNKKPSN